MTNKFIIIAVIDIDLDSSDLANFFLAKAKKANGGARKVFLAEAAAEIIKLKNGDSKEEFRERHQKLFQPFLEASQHE